MDEVSSAKQLSSIFPKLYANQLHYSSRHGWLCRDGDTWRPDEEQAMQVCRTFCAAAARQMRDRRMDSEATAEAVLRLSAFEPAMRAAIPDGHIRLGGAWA